MNDRIWLLHDLQSSKWQHVKNSLVMHQRRACVCMCVWVRNIDVCREKLLASAAGYKDTVSALEEKRVRLLTGVDTDKADTNTFIFFTLDVQC